MSSTTSTDMTENIEKMPFDNHHRTFSDSSFSIQLKSDSDPCIKNKHSTSILRIAASEFLGTMMRVLFVD